MGVVFEILAAALAALGLGFWLGQRGSSQAAAEARDGAQKELDRLRLEQAGLLTRAVRAEQAAEDARLRLKEDQERLDKLRIEIGLEAGRLLTEKSVELRAEAGRHFE